MVKTSNREIEVWRDTIWHVLNELSPKEFHHLSAIYAGCKQRREMLEVPLPPTFHATIRRTLQHGRRFVAGPEKGYWGLKTAVSEDTNVPRVV